MSEESLPLRQWPAGIEQASVPANENAVRVQALLSRALSVENDAPGTEYNGAVYIVGSTPTGAFATFSEHDIALFEFGSWYAWAPPLDTSMVINDVRKVFDGTEWVDDPSMEPSIAAGTTGQFWRGDKAFSDELHGALKINQDSAPHGQPGLEVTADASLGAIEHANVTSTTYGHNGGGTFHGRYARGTRASPLPVMSGDIYAGIGGRPYHSGGDFFSSSPVSVHWVASEDQGPANAGGCLRVLTTPVGTASRKISAVVAADGDFVIGEYDSNPIPVISTRGLVIIREGVQSEQAQYSYGVPGFSAGIRLLTCRGTVAAPEATQSADGAFIGFCGHDGVNYQVSAAAGIFLQAFNNWSPTSRPATITLATTTDGTATRVARWYVWHSGEFLPAQDNTYDAGGPINRIRTVYAATGTINTSDAREKTTVRQLSDKELAAAKALSGEVGAYRWLAAIEAKGDGARLHIGLTVQRAIEIMESHDLDPFAYGFICHDQWEEQAEVVKDGEILRPHVSAGDRYSFRMDELCLFLARGQEERLRRLEQAAGL